MTATSRTYTTTSGTEYHVIEGGARAYPVLGPDFFPADLWDVDCATARGETVERDLPVSSYAVSHAGPGWREVWEWLNDR